MGKYEPLGQYLKGLKRESWDAEFTDIEKVLQFELPHSAHRHSAWWANESHGSHSHARSWREAGWETANVDLARKRLRFVRARKQIRSENAEPSDSAMADLWEQAREVSGIEDRNALLKAALATFIRREAAKGLVALGGTMPEFTVPPRERPAR